ncbi:MAG TPA: hypothetical protein PK200_01245 [Spirochaetota bacterium]|nr:hypothetical protein [Spirochaetota bacterium]HQO04391.1 hypothetical protein [Spirochaetota bacterium]
MNSGKYQRRDRACWQTHIQTWKDSGLSQTEYCRQNNISLSSFTNWKAKISSEVFRDQAFVELRHENISYQQNCIEFVVDNDLSIKVREDIPVLFLKNLFLALRGV